MDPFQKIQKEIEVLRAQVAELQARVERLSEAGAGHLIEALLWQQGFPVFSHGAKSNLVFPPNAASAGLSAFYRLMRRYSFRLFMRDLIQTPRGGDLNDLTRYCSLKTVRSYAKTLAGLEIISLEGCGYRLLKNIPSFGPTLEWFVCETFQREFLAPALFNVRLQNTKSGGDYDVISTIAGRLVYVEVKSSPPRGVEHQAVSAFLDRVGDIEPNISILFVDTELRMKDKLVPMLAEALEKEGRTGPRWAVTRLVDEIFQVNHSIYLMNSRKGVYSNLRTCFRDYFLWDRKSRTVA